MSDCCSGSKRPGDELDILHISRGVSRRSVLKGMAATAGLAALSGVSGQGFAAGRKVTLAFCSHLLCVVPYEVTREAGFFAAEGLDVELIYTRGGSAALQALNGGAVDYAATSFDAALNAFSNGADIVRFATTGRLPLFALATSPQKAGSIKSIEDLADTTIGVAALGNSDHALALYLLERAGVDSDTVRFATLGPNLFHALRLGQVDAGMVQEPALALLKEEGSRVLANLMRTEDAERYLGGPYEFMGVAVRQGEVEQRREEMQALARALAKGLKHMQKAPVESLVDALPDELIAGGDPETLERVLATYRASLYPEEVTIRRDACERVMQAHLKAGIQEKPVDMDRLLNTSIISAG